MLTSHVKYSLFFPSESICQAVKKTKNKKNKKNPAKRSKINWNEANIETYKVHLNLIYVGKENQHVKRETQWNVRSNIAK